MKLIAGLGNPGAKYRDTRHNVGFKVIDELARRQGAPFGSAPAEALVARLREPGDGVLLVKPLTYMNLSGSAVGALVRYYRIELPDLLVVFDEVALPLGRLRARPRGSAGGHNGLKSIIEALGTSEIQRLRVGVGRGDTIRDLSDHVLARFEASEQAAADEAIQRAADAAALFVSEGIEKVMNAFNRDPASENAENNDEERETGKN